MTPVFKRVLLKISGEGFCEEGGFGIEAAELDVIAKQCVEVARMGVQLAVVVGGGNFIRGATFSEQGRIPRATADYMGMMATILNAVALQETMESMGQPTRVLSALSVYSVCEPFIRRRAVRHLEKGRCIILAAGTGNPYFTTDTCAALRATEIHADVLMKATKVDGIYSADPKKDPNAKLYREISYQQVLNEQLRVMDLTAITLAMERKLPLLVFNMKVSGNIECAIVETNNHSDLNPETTMPLDDVLLDCEMNMEKSVEHLQHELRGIRTGRASPALVEHVKVDYYGSLTDIRSIAAISVPEALQIVVKPFSPGDLRAIEKAISDANLGLTTHSDGKQLRLNLPPLSQDRRIQLAGQCKKFAEEAKIHIRNARREGNKILETEQKGGEITEDELTKGKDQVQELTKSYEAKVDAVIEHKRSEIMTV